MKTIKNRRALLTAMFIHQQVLLIPNCFTLKALLGMVTIILQAWNVWPKSGPCIFTTLTIFADTLRRSLISYQETEVLWPYIRVEQRRKIRRGVFGLPKQQTCCHQVFRLWDMVPRLFVELALPCTFVSSLLSYAHHSYWYVHGLISYTYLIPASYPGQLLLSVLSAKEEVEGEGRWSCWTL